MTEITLSIDAAIALAIGKSLDSYTPTAITSDEQSSEAMGVVKNLKRLIAKVDEIRKSYTAPLDQKKKELIAKQKALSKPLEDRVAEIEKYVSTYVLAREKARKEAESKLLKAAEDARIAMENAESEKPSSEILADEFESALTCSLTDAEKSALTKMDGTTVRTTWDFEIEDPDKVVRSFCSPDESKIRSFLRDLKSSGVSIEEVSISGVRIYEKVRAVAR